MTRTILITLTLFVSACSTGQTIHPEPLPPDSWTSYESENIQQVEAQTLKNWWRHFDDTALNQLIDITLTKSPDRNIARARIAEARGLRRTTRSALFPQVDFSANGSRQDFGFVGPDQFYDSQFDASFELDVYGRNRKNLNAAEAQLLALENDYYDVTLSLIADVSRSYIDYRGFAKQVAIAEKNLRIQQKTLSLIRTQKEFGEAPQLDVERAENIVNTTKASIPEFRRLTDNARLQLSILTGEQPEKIMQVLALQGQIPGADIEPVLLTPTQALTLRPDVQAASATLSANTLLTEATTTELLPTFTLSSFFGISQGPFTSANSIWSIALGTAVNLIDFGRIEGRIDAARARETLAYEQYRRTILSAISEVETALTDYSRINDQRVSQKKAYNNAEKTLDLSQILYREGEVSFLDVLDAQRTVNDADSALVSSEVAQAESLIRIYKSLGVY